MQRPTEHIFFLALFACLNCHIAGVPNHLPLLDIGCAFGLALATAQLTKAGGNTTVQAALALMWLRWASSVASVVLSPTVSIDVKKFAVCVELVGFCGLVVV